VSPLDLRTSRNLDKFKAMAPFNGPTYNNTWVPHPRINLWLRFSCDQGHPCICYVFYSIESVLIHQIRMCVKLWITRTFKSTFTGTPVTMNARAAPLSVHDHPAVDPSGRC
jgi:hypothetical protein